MKKFTTLALAAIVAGGGFYAASTTLTTAFAARPDQSDAPAILNTQLGQAGSLTTAATQEIGDAAVVDDKRNIRCYFRADLTTTYPVMGSPGDTMPPYMLTGLMAAGFDAKNDPAVEDPDAGMMQIRDPISICADLWDKNDMNPDGITNDLIPEGFNTPAPLPAPQIWNGMDRDADGNPIIGSGMLVTAGHFIPELTECVVDGIVSVIPGPASICSTLGVHPLAK